MPRVALAFHLLRSWDSLQRPCWLLHDGSLTGPLARSIRRVVAFHQHFDREVRAFVFEPQGFLPLTRIVERHPAFSEWCKRCWQGEPCEHWDVGILENEGYGGIRLASVLEAAERLGLKWPWTEEQVVRAFRAKALHAHPDQGGTDAAMCQLLEDRDRLLERCAVVESHGV